MKKMTKYLPHFLAVIAIPVTLGVTALWNTTAEPTQVVTIKPTITKEFSKTVVMIRMVDKRSGGSGVILSSSLAGSTILTNKHVCGVVKEGGIVTTTDGTDYKVEEYKEYSKHDLCMINVKENLGVNTIVAEKEPTLYTTARISGHPALMPHVVSEGYFSSYQDIDIMTGLKPCDGTEPDEDILSCMFLGGVPIVQKFEAEMVTALIMAGSSGSAVFNTDGEIEALVFAGAGQGLSYAFVVPHKFVQDFIKNQSQYKWEKPVTGPVASQKRLIRDEDLMAICSPAARVALYSDYCNGMLW